MEEYNGSKALQDFFKVVSLSADKGDVIYISTLESRRVSQAIPGPRILRFTLLSMGMMQIIVLAISGLFICLAVAWGVAAP